MQTLIKRFLSLGMLAAVATLPIQSRYLPFSAVQVLIEHDVPTKQTSTISDENDEQFFSPEMLVYTAAFGLGGFIAWQMFGASKNEGSADACEKNRDRVHHVDVQRQEGADCGFHAVGNGSAAYLILKDVQDSSLLKNLSQRLQFPLENWRDAVRQKYGSSSWLSDEEVDYLAKEHAGLNQQTYMVIPDVIAFGASSTVISVDPDYLTKVLMDLRTRNGAVYLFLLGNMQERAGNDGSPYGTRGHWISVVAHREANVLSYYVMDSLGGTRESMVSALIDVVEKRDINEIQQSGMKQLLESAQNFKKFRGADREKIQEAFNKLGKIKANADQYVLYETGAFIRNYAVPICELITKEIVPMCVGNLADLRPRAEELAIAFAQRKKQDENGTLGQQKEPERKQ